MRIACAALPVSSKCFGLPQPYSSVGPWFSLAFYILGSAAAIDVIVNVGILPTEPAPIPCTYSDIKLCNIIAVLNVIIIFTIEFR